MPKKLFHKPEGYRDAAEETYPIRGWDGWGITGWTKYQSDGYCTTPACVPVLHRGLKADVYKVAHRMEHPCYCKENSDKLVRCFIHTSENDDLFLGEHLPGQCPAMNYRPRRRGKKCQSQLK